MPAEAVAATVAAEEVLWAPPPRGYSAMNVSSVLLLRVTTRHSPITAISFRERPNSEFSIFLL